MPPTRKVHHLHVDLVRSIHMIVEGFLAAFQVVSQEFWKTMQTTERRKQRRLPLRWPVRLSGGRIGTVEAWTKNLSASSFYCVVDSPLAPGEKIDCGITVPGRGQGDPTTIGSIKCQAEVIRVDALGVGEGFGIAIRIIDFSFSLK